MNLQAVLGIRPGITSVIGSGGKTTLLARLAEELAPSGTVALTTTTHILPFEGMPLLDGEDLGEVCRALTTERVVCVAGRSEQTGKLEAPACGAGALAQVANYVLVEADGSRRLPLKAHEAWEPVVPEGSGQSVLVVGASGFGRPVREVVHRPEVFCRLAGCGPDDAATPEAVAAVIRAEGLASRVVVNQAEGMDALAAARQLAALLDVPVAAGSVRDGALVEV